ncbi:MAG: 50S ribosomal protein L2, partial [Akkermansiaceae bacterium]
MPLKSFKPVTPSNRYKMWPTYEEITKTKPEKSLTEPLPKSGGRNNQGKITCRHIGGGHKRKYRLIDFKRRKHDVEAKVQAVEYDPNRTCRIALLQYSDGQKSYILCPVGLQVGATVISGEDVAPTPGNAMPLKSVPLGTAIHNIELRPGSGGKIARAAGQQAVLSNRESGYALITMPSGEIRRFHE